MPKVKPKLAPGVNGHRPRHAMDADRGNKAFGHGRDRATVKRIHMYKTKAYKRDRDGKIIEGKGDLTSRIPEVGAGRVAPNRKWFGNTRVVQQQDLARFREAITKAQSDPYSVLLKQRKLPMGLIADADSEARALSGAKLGLLANEPFEETFSRRRRRKRPRLAVGSMEELAQSAAKADGEFEEEEERKRIESEEAAKRVVAESGGEVVRTIDLKEAQKPRVFDKGQSRRIWGELHKVIDSSDVVIQVIDARDPMGTRSKYLENFIRRECRHKHLILLLNKADLIPSWASARWLRVLSREFPTLVFHSSITNPFGKGSLINLLRQFKALHPEKKSISCGLVGYPNVGKSSVINTLRAKKVSKVAPVPGETKVWQYVTLFKTVYLIDCPGVVHDSTRNSEAESVLKGVVRVESLRDTAAEYIPMLLKRVEKNYLARTYGVNEWNDADDLLEKIARKAGKLLKKGEPDLNCVGRMMLSDFQRGKLPWFVPPPDEKVQEDDEKDIDDGSEKEGESEEKEPVEEPNITIRHEDITKLKTSELLDDNGPVVSDEE